MLNCNSSLTERQRALLSYWSQITATGQLPERRDINPGQLGIALASTSLVQKEGETFRFRLTGSRLENLLERSVKGKLLQELDATSEEAGSTSMMLALETGRPVAGNRKIGGRWHCWLRVPLLDEDGNPTLVLCLDEFPRNLPDSEEAKANGFFEEDRALLKRLGALAA